MAVISLKNINVTFKQKNVKLSLFKMNPSKLKKAIFMALLVILVLVSQRWFVPLIYCNVQPKVQSL
jgi:hypothetical protein